MQEAVRERRLPVVNVGDDAEISYVCGVHYFSDPERNRITVKSLKKRKFDQPGNRANCAKSFVTWAGGAGRGKGFVVPEVRLPWPEWIKT
jgi:hypothetical protein